MSRLGIAAFLSLAQLGSTLKLAHGVGRRDLAGLVEHDHVEAEQRGVGELRDRQRGHQQAGLERADHGRDPLQQLAHGQVPSLASQLALEQAGSPGDDAWPGDEEASSVAEEAALDYVLGYTAANDVSARLWQTDPARTSGQWNRGKGFDTFCPLGPALVLQERK